MEAERFVSWQALGAPPNPRPIRPDTLAGGRPNSGQGCYSFAPAGA